VQNSSPLQWEVGGVYENNHNLRIDFYEAMRRFHDEGFGILGAFVLGFDHEDRYVFNQTLEFIMKSRMDCAE